MALARRPAFGSTIRMGVGNPPRRMARRRSSARAAGVLSQSPDPLGWCGNTTGPRNRPGCPRRPRNRNDKRTASPAPRASHTAGSETEMLENVWDRDCIGGANPKAVRAGPPARRYSILVHEGGRSKRAGAFYWPRLRSERPRAAGRGRPRELAEYG